MTMLHHQSQQVGRAGRCLFFESAERNNAVADRAAEASLHGSVSSSLYKGRQLRQGSKVSQPEQEVAGSSGPVI